NSKVEEGFGFQSLDSIENVHEVGNLSNHPRASPSSFRSLSTLQSIFLGVAFCTFYIFRAGFQVSFHAVQHITHFPLKHLHGLHDVAAVRGGQGIIGKKTVGPIRRGME
ncbi:MAG: hypothetical protein LBF49_00415, partial [Puniceicoccales bacterium]|nr:hypothetical protein [Puniceicoccales bacterium]